MDELTALVRFDGNFRRSNLMCFTETWLTEDIDNSLGPGFTTIRADRDSDEAQNSVGGGLCRFVSDSWATQYCVRERVCTRDYQLFMAVSFRPFYLPREVGQITVILVYVPGPDFKTAAEKITESFNEAVSRSVDQPVFILGDFNSCDLSPHLPTLQQYITCPTRLNRTIDLCYGNTRAPTDLCVDHLWDDRITTLLICCQSTDRK